MSDELKTIKFQLMLSRSEAEAIDDWGFKNRIRTRAEAIRRLCQIGIVWDEQRTPVIHEFLDAFESLNKGLAAAAKTKPHGGQTELTERESAIVAAVFSGLLQMAQLLRRLHAAQGAAANLKFGDDIERELADLARLFDFSDLPDQESAKE